MTDYAEWLTRRNDYGANQGFKPLFIPDFLFDFQKYLVDWAVNKGRGAIFADCGLGKTPMQLVWAQNVVMHTNSPVLILTPLSVSGQTLREAEKFGIEAHRAHPGKKPHAAIHVTNYEQLHKYDPSQFGGVVCDESSILKNFEGEYRTAITEFMRRVPYRLLATATAAPNDWDELGNSSEALGELGYKDMLKNFFENNEKSSSKRRTGRWDMFDGRVDDKFRLRGHAVEPFWRWVASWSRACRKPSDIGFTNDGYDLPQLIEQYHEIKPSTTKDGMLFDVTAINFQEQREVIKRTIPERCEKASELVAQHDVSTVWCNLNPEGELLARLINGSWEISGRSSDEEKEEAVEWFINGTDTRRILITKPKIMGFGLNFQHCNHSVWFPTFSYEQYYQGVRRFWRFGQTRDVTIDNVYPEGGERMMQAIVRKASAADEMFAELIKHMTNALHIEKGKYTGIKLEAPSWLNAK